MNSDKQDKNDFQPNVLEDDFDLNTAHSAQGLDFCQSKMLQIHIKSHLPL